MEDLVYGFDKPHRVGSICGVRCEQCGSGNPNTVMTVMTGPGPTGRIDTVPLFIHREANYEEYEKSVIANGGGKNLSSPKIRHYYVVSTD